MLTNGISYKGEKIIGEGKITRKCLLIMDIVVHESPSSSKISSFWAKIYVTNSMVKHYSFR